MEYKLGKKVGHFLSAPGHPDKSFLHQVLQANTMQWQVMLAKELMLIHGYFPLFTEWKAIFSCQLDGKGKGNTEKNELQGRETQC